MSGEPLYSAKADFSKATVTVTSTAELNAALASLSKGTGGTILVDGSKGPYHISAENLGYNNSSVLITPLDADVPPQVQQIDIIKSSQITINGMEIDSAAINQSRNSWDFDVNIISSRDVAVVNSSMTGNADGMVTESGNATVGESAIMLRDSSNVVLDHNTIKDYNVGITYLEVKGLSIQHNDMSGIQGDGMRGGGIQDVVISHNNLHDFYGSTQTVNHSDMIQIWGTNVELQTKNVEISHNLFNAGEGAASQSILIQNEYYNNNNVYFDNISIHNNVIHNAMTQGIGTLRVKNLEVYDNTVLWDQHATTYATDGGEAISNSPRIVVRDSPGADVYGNIAEQILIGSTMQSTGANYIIDYKDEGADNYAGRHFVNYSGKGDLSVQDLSLRPSSDLHGEYGAETTSDLQTPLATAFLDGEGSDLITAVMLQDDLPGRNNGVELSAKYSLIDGKPITEQNATVTWTFENGQTAQGIDAIHIFDAPGDHTISMRIETTNGQSSNISRQFETTGEAVFEIDFNRGGIDMSEYASDISIVGSDGTPMVGGRSGQAFDLDGRARFEIDRTNEQFTGLETFQIDLGFKLDAGRGNEGNLVQLHNAFTLAVTNAGALVFTLETKDGLFEIETGNAVIKAGQWADISVQYDGFKGSVDLVVDGKVAGTGPATGITTADDGHALLLGSKWATSVKGAVDTFTMTTPDSLAVSYKAVTGTVTSKRNVIDEPSKVIEETEVKEAVAEVEDTVVETVVPEPKPEPTPKPVTKQELREDKIVETPQNVAPVDETPVKETPAEETSVDKTPVAEDTQPVVEALKVEDTPKSDPAPAVVDTPKVDKPLKISDTPKVERTVEPEEAPEEDQSAAVTEIPETETPDTRVGTSDNDMLYAGQFDLDGPLIDRLFGGEGNDTLNGSDKADELFGGAGNDKINGGLGQMNAVTDYLYGEDGNDILRSGQIYAPNSQTQENGDHMDGGAGNDILESGMANDTMRGGTDADMFLFHNGFGKDIILDFDAKEKGEVINLSSLTNITSFEDLRDNHLFQSGSDLLIRDTARDVITLAETNFEDLVEEHFVF